MSDSKGKNPLVELTIRSINKKGNGIASLERPHAPPIKVEVPFTLVGEVVNAKLTSKRHRCFHSTLQEIITPSPSRIPARCVHFGTCGGCRLQHTPYEIQLKDKEQFVRDCFHSLITAEVVFKEIIPSPEPWHYRNKMEYSFSGDAAGKKYLGLVIDGSRGKVLNLTECHLTHSWFVDALKTVRAWWHSSDLQAYHMHRNTGSLRTLTLREGKRTGDRMVILTVSGNEEFALQKSHIESFVAYIRDAIEPISSSAKLSIFLRIQQVGKGMRTQMYEMQLFGPEHIREILEIRISPDHAKQQIQFEISPSAFFQPNSRQAERLYSAALEITEISKEDVVYDLYCGAGAFGISVSKYVKQVIGIELSPEAALDAKANAALNGCDNVAIFSGDVKEILRELPEKGVPAADLVIVDPPRAGLCSHALQLLIDLGVPKILYVSCNPITQAENIKELVKAGYQLQTIQPVDQFPQTYHVENIAYLNRISVGFP